MSEEISKIITLSVKVIFNVLLNLGLFLKFSSILGLLDI